MTVQLILPERSDDDLSLELRWLTQQIMKRGHDDQGGFGLGGEYGYGVTYENEVFAMHRYCWCGRYDCPWCSYSDEEGQHFQERFRVNGAVPEHGGAPNFWHKSSGFKVWWYKWIGRDNETEGRADDVHQMVLDCRDSVPRA